MLNKNLMTKLKTYVKQHFNQVDIQEMLDASPLTYHTSESVVSDELHDFVDNHKKPTFQEVLFYFIDRKGTNDVTIYKKAWMDRKHFSKIRSNPNYQIGKNSAIALALALELSMSEAKELLHAAGFTLSNSNTLDLVIQFCLENNIYNLHDVNEALDYFDIKPVGSVK